MAFMNQDKKRPILDALKKVLDGTGLKWSLKVEHKTSLVLTITSGPVDFIGNYNQVAINNPHPTELITKGHMTINEVWYREHFTGEVLALVTEIVKCMNIGNWNESDIQSDYFNIGHFVYIYIGKWDKDYILSK